MMGGVNLHIFMSPCTHESRMMKEATTLIGAGLFSRVVVLGLGEPDLDEAQDMGPAIFVERPRLTTRNLPKNLVVQAAKYFEWAIRILFRARKYRPAVVHAHSLPALPISVLVSWLWQIPLVYDAHELETEQDNERGLRQRAARWVECKLIRHASAVLVVSDSIADWYERSYRIRRPLVLRNFPSQAINAKGSCAVPLRQKLGLSEEDVLFIYQGSLATGRGIERLLRVFSGTVERKHIVFMGFGLLRALIIEHADRFPNIHYAPAVHPTEVLSYTSGADVGMCLIENTCLSYFYSLPNKLFEYLAAGLPAAVNGFPEQRQIVERFGCGWLVEDSDDSISELVRQIDAAGLGPKKAAAMRAGAVLTWESEAPVLLNAYKSLT